METVATIGWAFCMAAFVIAGCQFVLLYIGKISMKWYMIMELPALILTLVGSCLLGAAGSEYRNLILGPLIGFVVIWFVLPFWVERRKKPQTPI